MLWFCFIVDDLKMEIVRDKHDLPTFMTSAVGLRGDRQFLVFSQLIVSLAIDNLSHPEAMLIYM